MQTKAPTITFARAFKLNISLLPPHVVKYRAVFNIQAKHSLVQQELAHS